MKRILPVPILVIAFLLMAACNGVGPESDGDQAVNSASNTASNTAANALADFARCMREHGQNVPDPDPNSPNLSLTPPSGGPSSQWNAAMQACRHLLPGGGAPQAPDPRELEGLRAYAVCMREHGIEMTDPDPNTGQSKYQGRLANAGKAEIENDPGFKAAYQACKDKLAQPEGK
jgi:hypothetical protein